MNLTDYPTPQIEQFLSGSFSFTDRNHELEQLYDLTRRIEQQAAAWRAVAEKYRSSEFVKGTIGVLETLKEADEAFDALKSQLTQP